MSPPTPQTTDDALRVTPVNARGVSADGAYVLYWMIAARRTCWNFAIDRAIAWAKALEKPLCVVEALRCGHRWASDRLHRFILDGMRENRAALAAAPVMHHTFVEPRDGDGRGMFAAMAARACVVVTDDFPCFMLPRMVAAAAEQSPVRMEQVDSNGLLPMRAATQPYPTAFALRRFLQKTLPDFLLNAPHPDPLMGLKLPRPPKLPAEVLRRWPAADDALLAGEPAALGRLAIDHTVAPTTTRGGAAAARDALKRFLDWCLARYADERNQPQEDVASGLSPYLHFGHLSVHEIFTAVARREGWSPARLAATCAGKKEGWWGMSPPAEAFLDELVTWRELGFNFCRLRADYDRYESLPDWARTTLDKHARDRRAHCYSLKQFEEAATHDPLWNAAQTQLRREGRIHNYLRMLWGKKILEWSSSPREALEFMIELNNKYALDGRNPNSYSGIFWVLGRYDRPWFPERPIFGTIRYMSSDNTARKVRVGEYVRRYS